MAADSDPSHHGPRVEDDALIRGRGQFVDDVEKQGVAHAVFVPMTRRAASRELCCAALFGDPVALAARYTQGDAQLGTFLGWDSGSSSSVRNACR